MTAQEFKSKHCTPVTSPFYYQVRNWMRERNMGFHRGRLITMDDFYLQLVLNSYFKETERMKRFTNGLYLIEVLKPFAWMEEKCRFQIASFNKSMGIHGRFFIKKGVAGNKSVAFNSVRVIWRVKQLKTKQ